MEALRGTRRSVSMHAVRDTELAKIPEGLLKHIRVKRTLFKVSTLRYMESYAIITGISFYNLCHFYHSWGPLFAKKSSLEHIRS